jgi:hypothetical protein
LSGKDFVANIADLFIKGFDTNSNNIDLFVGGSIFVNNDLTLFISGPILINENIDLFISGFTSIVSSISGNIALFIKGSFVPSGASCPTLDPNASIQISDELIGIYQSRIDALINQLGKNVLLEFDPIIEPCVNCEFNIIEHRSNGIYKLGGPIPFSRGQKCPYCKGQGFLERPNNKCLKCLIQWRPQDMKNYGISVSNSSDIVRLKTFLTSGDDIIKAKTAVTNHDISDVLLLRVRLIRGPIIVGLRESRYIISYWERI